jgi:spermidine/putrescine transport system ATP-binding protein
MNEYSVVLENVRKIFDDDIEREDFAAVDGIDLQVLRGEFFTLLGPSGCGKTTTLRLIAGFTSPSEGRILIDGVDATCSPPYQRPVHTVFQNYALFPHMTVAQNIAYGLKIAGINRQEIQSRVKKALRMVQLGDLGSRKPSQLSGGQQQRVALARALVNEPAVLLLDEPLGALDLKLRKDMQWELKKLQQMTGITFIYVTHDQEEALTMSDRIAVLSEGKIVQIGTPHEIYNHPKTHFVADFIGESNFVKAKVEHTEGSPSSIRFAGSTFPLPEFDKQLKGRKSVLLAVRPEQLALGSSGSIQHGCDWHFPAVVSASIFIGSDVRVEVTLPDGQKMKILKRSIGRDMSTIYQQGDAVQVGLKMHDIHIFDL